MWWRNKWNVGAGARLSSGPLFTISATSSTKSDLSWGSWYQLRRICGPEVTALCACHRHCGKRRAKVRVERLALRTARVRFDSKRITVHFPAAIWMRVYTSSRRRNATPSSRKLAVSEKCDSEIRKWNSSVPFMSVCTGVLLNSLWSESMRCFEKACLLRDLILELFFYGATDV